MIFGALSTLGVIAALIGAIKLYRGTPTWAQDEDGNLAVLNPQSLVEVKQKHRRAWGWIIGGFFLQLAGSVGWLLGVSH